MSDKWPFPRDGISTRARKMALAYRQLATEQHQRAEAFRNVLASLDQRLLRFMDPDTAEAVAKLIAETTPDPVAELDQRFTSWGEKWHADIEVTYGPDDWVTSAEGGPLIQRHGATLNQMRLRGLIKGRWVKATAGKQPHWEYRVKDVYALQTQLKGQGWRAAGPTDTVADSGRSDSK